MSQLGTILTFLHFIFLYYKIDQPVLTFVRFATCVLFVLITYLTKYTQISVKVIQGLFLVCSSTCLFLFSVLMHTDSNIQLLFIPMTLFGAYLETGSKKVQFIFGIISTLLLNLTYVVCDHGYCETHHKVASEYTTLSTHIVLIVIGIIIFRLFSSYTELVTYSLHLCFII